MVNHLLYAGSFIFAERLGLTAKKGNKKKQEQKKPFWQRRIENSIVQWRKHLCWVEEHRKGNLKNNVKIKELNHKYAIREKGALAVSSLLKGKIKSGATKIKNYVKSQIKRSGKTLYSKTTRANGPKSLLMATNHQKQEKSLMLKRQQTFGKTSGLSRSSMTAMLVGSLISMLNTRTSKNKITLISP